MPLSMRADYQEVQPYHLSAGPFALETIKDVSTPLRQLVTEEGKVYKIANQDKVTAHAGHKVTISGTIDGDTIKAESVKM